MVLPPSVRSRTLAMPDGRALGRRVLGVVRVQVTATHAGADNAYQRVRGGLEFGVRCVDDADVAGTVDVGRLHVSTERLISVTRE